jgi:demethylmenaquinone methyltransferase/2-methoxy-6-polyprenyl-1,4-benzoquinol methylase
MDKQAIIKFFDKCSENWDAHMITDDDKMNKIMDTACVSQGKDILDIACGTGVMFNYYLSRNVNHITGVDISSEMIKICRDKFSSNDKIDVICADADTMTFDGNYDCCIVFNAFPHFIDPKALISNLYTSVKTGGTLTIAHDRGRKALDIHHSGEANPYSNGLMSEDDLEQIFIDCGFTSTTKYATDEIYIVSGRK